MGKVILDLSMSLDGYIAGPKDDDNPDRELAALEILHDWMFRGKTEQEAVAWQEEKFKPVGAIIIGWRTFDMGLEPWGDNPTFHAPCFVLSSEAKETIVKQGGTSYSFVTDGIVGALDEARAAAVDKDVRVLGGANVAQQYLKAGLLDEIRLQLVPVLLGDGIRLFEHLEGQRIKLEQIDVVEDSGVTHMKFRVLK